MTLCLPHHYWQLSILCGSLWPWSFLGGCFGIEDMKESTWRATQRHSSLSSPTASSGTELKYLYGDVLAWGINKNCLGLCAFLQGCDLIGITEMCWNGANDWSFQRERYRLFRKSKKGRWGRWGGVILCQWPTGMQGALPWSSQMRSQLKVYRSALKGEQE